MIYAKGFKDRKPSTISPKYAQWVPPIKRYFQTIRGRWNCLGIILAQTTHVSFSWGVESVLEALPEPPESTKMITILL
jgi:hypothetical protein